MQSHIVANQTVRKRAPTAVALFVLAIAFPPLESEVDEWVVGPAGQEQKRQRGAGGDGEPRSELFQRAVGAEPPG